MAFSNTVTGSEIMRKLPVRWGLSLPNRGVLFGLTNIDTILDAAVLAEESGVFESVWFGDSLIHKPRVESIVMLSAAAAMKAKCGRLALKKRNASGGSRKESISSARFGATKKSSMRASTTL